MLNLIITSTVQTSLEPDECSTFNMRSGRLAERGTALPASETNSLVLDLVSMHITAAALVAMSRSGEVDLDGHPEVLPLGICRYGVAGVYLLCCQVGSGFSAAMALLERAEDILDATEARS